MSLQPPARADLEAALAAAARRAARWFPSGFDPAAVVAFGRERYDESIAVEDFRFDDVMFAYACSAGATGALRELDAMLQGFAAHALRRVSLAGASIDEVVQAVREHLLVSADRAPRLLAYHGRAPLRAWLRVAVTRIVVDLGRHERRKRRVDTIGLDPAIFAGATDPELAHLDAGQRVSFRRAFEAAVADLSDRDREVLRLRFVEGAPIDEIGRLHRVHRATAARWLSAAREALVAGTRLRLAQGSGLEGDELESVVRRARQTIDLSLISVIGHDPPPRSKG